MRKIDTKFENWLAGFTDGEWSFIIAVATKKQCRLGFYFVPIYAISQKDTLIASQLFKKIIKYIGTGFITRQVVTWKYFRRNGVNHKTNIIKLQISNLKGLLKLVEIFDRAPPAIKIEDYKLWREAVILRKKEFGFGAKRTIKVQLRLLELKKKIDKKTFKGRRAKWTYKQIEKRIRRVLK